MFCTSCGTHLTDDARFCTICGKATARASELIAAGPAGNLTGLPTRRLRRVLAKKKLAGVCAGFADYFGMDVTLMRLIWIGLLIMPPYVGVIAYIISWIVLPKD